MNLKRSKEGYMCELGRRKGKREMTVLYFNLKN